MKVFVSTLLFTFVVIHAHHSVSAQARQEGEKKQESSTSIQTFVTPEQKTEPTLISIQLVGGGRLQVEDVQETNDGIWYRRGGVTTLLDPKRVLRIERPSSGQNKQLSATAEEPQHWSLADATKVENFFFTKFSRPLPTSAFGQSDIHDRWGLDHRQGLDVGLHPDSVEGVALVEFLRAERIPFLVFRRAIPGVATGPHIHIGHPSHRYLPR
ncbi:MAG TPA: hypothetical protein VLE19_07330 [Pyrinomonadaceae bacterium]|nr:hypothetical protein [Pyrinomonadaceae bacterium]